jgi:hypothetical protein
MIARTRRPLAERQAFMAAVARAICDTAAPLTVAGPSDQS